MDRSYEYAKMQYEWITKCLIEDEKWEELAFFVLGVDLGIRISELKNIKWDQIEFPFVKNIEIIKANNINGKEHYEPLEISLNTFETINRIYDKSVDRYVFQYNPYHYIGSISESIGITFNGYSMRNMSIVFKAKLLQETRQ